MIPTPLDTTVTPDSNIAQTQTTQQSGELGPSDYSPTPEQQQKISLVRDKREKFRKVRQPHEQQWFVNNAMLRGQQYVEWSVRDQKLTVPPAPPHRIRLAINRVKPKIKARRSKWLKNRTKLEVYAASPDVSSRLDARASKKALDYVWRKDNLEKKKRLAMMQAEVCGKGFWWIYWDANKIGRVQITDELTGQPSLQEAVLGDVCVEVGSAYEVLVGNPSVPTLAGQPEILRVKLRPMDDVKGRYPEFAPFITPDSNQEDLFRYEKQISTLNASGFGGFGLVEIRDKGNLGVDQAKTMVLVTEYFEAPCPSYPKGRYMVLAGNVLVKEQDFLPYGFHDLENPFPCVEFVDDPSPSQFWSTTLIEQLTPLQREYNLARSKLAEHIRISVHPKIIVFKQHRMPKNAWNSEPGEIIELLAAPGIPPPIIVNPPALSADLWQAIQLVKGEFDDISGVFPAAEGKPGGATSGFQTNLLQEATDQVHQPDLINLHMALEEAALKIRRVMKEGYTTPRVVTAIGKSMEPEVTEFYNDQIDEFAEIRIEGSGALPDNKAIRINMVKEMFESGLLGPPDTPDAVRKALSFMDLSGPEDALDDARIDENQANIENNQFTKGEKVTNAEFYEDHSVHYKVHTNLLKSSETRQWPEEQRMALIVHVISHLDHFDPNAAAEAALQYNLPIPPNALRMQQQMMQQQQMMMEQQAMNGGQSGAKQKEPVNGQPISQ